jgi:transposase
MVMQPAPHRQASQLPTSLGTDERGEVRWHPVFLDFARYWGFQPRLCRPYRVNRR